MTKISRSDEQLRDELCPVWLSFFEDIVESEQALRDVQRKNYKTLSDVCTSSLLLTAETKYLWVQSMFDMVSAKGGYIKAPADIELNDRMTNLGWNRFCYKIAKGVRLQKAITWLRRFDKGTQYDTRAVHEGYNGLREFFAFSRSADFRPWMQYTENLDPASSTATAIQPQCNYEPISKNIGWTNAPSYPPSYLSVQEAMTTAELNGGVVYASEHHKVTVADDTILLEYNRRREEASLLDPNIPFPTASYQMYELIDKEDRRARFPARTRLARSRWVEIKTATFFFDGCGIAYKIEPDARLGAVVVPKLSIYDVKKTDRLYQQLQVEQ